MHKKRALEKLIEGNKRFVNAQQAFPNLSSDRRQELLEGQNPFAIIIGCSDSRVPPEIIFEQGLGDLFVIRKAGNIIDKNVMGSAEYAAATLDVSLVIILGHEDCGAVKSAMLDNEDSEFIKSIIKNIKPAVDKNSLYNSTVNNIKIQANRLKTTGNIIPNLEKQGKLDVLGGYYSLKTGKVDFFEII